MLHSFVVPLMCQGTTNEVLSGKEMSRKDEMKVRT